MYIINYNKQIQFAKCINLYYIKDIHSFIYLYNKNVYLNNFLLTFWKQTSLISFSQ